MVGGGISALRWSAGRARFFDTNGCCVRETVLRPLKPLSDSSQKEPLETRFNPVARGGDIARWLRFQARATRLRPSIRPGAPGGETLASMEETVGEALPEGEEGEEGEEPSSPLPEYSESSPHS